jgi:hypothetical protein
MLESVIQLERETYMQTIKHIALSALILATLATTTGCVVAEPREGYWDRDHHRYYHEHVWHECTETDRGEYCR